MRTIAGLVAALALLGGTASAQKPDDRTAIAAAIEKMNLDLRAAWQARDAALVFPRNEAARIDLQLRMNQTTAILEMTETPSDIRIEDGQATVVSDQTFRRMVRQADGSTRERLATATHRRKFLRSAAGEWTSDGSLETLGQTGRWADGKP